MLNAWVPLGFLFGPKSSTVNPMSFRIFFIMLITSIALTEQAGANEKQYFVSGDVGFSIFGETGNRENLFRSLSQATRGGLRWGQWGVYAHVEPVGWVAAEGIDSETWTSALNLGLGADYLYADGHLKASLTVGPSIMLKGTKIDQPGDTGFFIDIRPAGFRWSLSDVLVMGLEPLALSVTAPALGGIPLVEFAYRTNISIECMF